MNRLVIAAAGLLCAVTASSAQAQVWTWKKLPDQRGEFVRLCAPHMISRWAHPESVCACLHDYAAARVADPDLREAVLRGIAETGVPAIEDDWLPASKRAMIPATFTALAKPTLQCMFDPAK